MMSYLFSLRRIFDGLLLTAAFFSLLILWALNVSLFQKTFYPEVFLAWFLTFLNHLTGLFFKKISFDKPVIQFFAFSLGLNTLKAFCFLVAVFLILAAAPINTRIFAASLSMSYLVFFIFEIIALSFLSSEPMARFKQ
jgi:hypothetical protein